MASSSQQLLLFANRFLEVHAGPSVMRDPVTALVELVANAWDSGATEVKIRWPDPSVNRTFRIEDNGHGMTEGEFGSRWMTLSYDRLEGQGRYAQFPPGVENKKRRPAFGRNGIGRHAMFCFGDSYTIRTRKDGIEIGYRIRRGRTQPLAVEQLETKERKGHGTSLESQKARAIGLTAQRARAEVGMRFLIDPSFVVYIDGVAVAFDDLPNRQIDRIDVDAGIAGPISILVLDTRDSDRTAKQHGVAWHVNGRLVGRCSWEGTGHERFLDGRRSEAKRYTFIVMADGIADAVGKDWNRFDRENPLFLAANEVAQEAIRAKLIELTQEKRQAMAQAVRDALEPKVAKLSPLSRERWVSFVDDALIACPSISEKELTSLAGVLAKLEDAKSQYGLISQLNALDTSDLDDLHRILSNWSLRFAKIVLDEVENRLRLVDELHKRVLDPNTKEVQELQPLFKRGLWLFGPEFESIEFTSNVGMTSVIQTLFHRELEGSKNRPDFAILPDSTVGLYSYPRFDESMGEIGVERLTVIELKRPGIEINDGEKGQAWKYVKELIEKGLLQDYSKVTCFVLGTNVSSSESGARTDWGGRVTIQPLNYSTVLSRARARLMKLYEQVKDAPFLNEKLEEFVASPVATPALFSLPTAAPRRAAEPKPSA